MLVTLLVVVIALIVAMFALTFYNLSAPRSTLRNILGLKPRLRFGKYAGRGEPAMKGLLDQAADKQAVSQKVLDTLSLSARVGKRTTRTTLAITGFALLGLILVGLLGLSGAGVRDLRSQVVAAVTTLVAAIAGFYFGSQGSGGSGAPAAPGDTAGTQRVINEVVPPTGKTEGSERIAIIGSGLSTAAGVSIGNIAATQLGKIGDTALTVVTPARATTGAVDVTVVFTDGSQVTHANGFTYT